MKDRVQNKQPAWFNKDFQVALVVKKNPPANPEDSRDAGSTPGSG